MMTLDILIIQNEKAVYDGRIWKIRREIQEKNNNNILLCNDKMMVRWRI